MTIGIGRVNGKLICHIYHLTYIEGKCQIKSVDILCCIIHAWNLEFGFLLCNLHKLQKKHSSTNFERILGCSQFLLSLDEKDQNDDCDVKGGGDDDNDDDDDNGNSNDDDDGDDKT